MEAHVAAAQAEVAGKQSTIPAEARTQPPHQRANDHQHQSRNHHHPPQSLHARNVPGFPVRRKGGHWLSTRLTPSYDATGILAALRSVYGADWLVAELLDGGAAGGAPADALVYDPFGLAMDADGNLYVADTYNQVFRVVYR